MLSPSQIRAARAMLDWSREDLATAAGISAEGLFKIERGVSKPLRSTEDKIIGAFLEQGVIFTDDDGVKRQNASIKIYKGKRAFVHWFDDVYETVKTGGEIAVTGAKESDYANWLSPEEDQRHTDRMSAIAALVTCRVILCEGDSDFAYSTYVTYRWIARERWDRNTLYIYGGKSAIIEFLEDGPVITVVDAPAATRAFRKIFEAMWETCRDIPPRRVAS